MSGGGEIAYDEKAGRAYRLEGGKWVDTDLAVNEKSGQRFVYDGADWRELPRAPKPAAEGGGVEAVLSNVARGAADLAKYGPLGPLSTAADKAFPGLDSRAGLENLGAGVARGVSGLVGLPRVAIDAPADIANWANRKLQGPDAPQMRAPSQVAGPVMDVMAPASADVHSAIAQVAPEVNRSPATSSGRLLQDVGQAIGGAPFLPMMPYNLAAGLGAWGAGEVSGQNPIAKAGGSVLAMLAPAAWAATVPNATKMLQGRLGQYTPAQLNAAEALQAQAQGRGIGLMAHEALDATRSGPMAQLAGTAAAQPQGRAIVEFAQGRVAPSGAIPTAIDDAANAIAPRVANPNEVSRTLAAAADKAVKEPQIARAAAANPLKARAAGDIVDDAMKAQTIARIDSALAEANPSGPVAKQLSAFRTQVDSAKTVGQFDEALDAFRTIAKAQAFEGSAVPDAVRTALKPIIRGGYVGLETTNPTYQAFREVYKGSGGQPSRYSVAVDEAAASPAARIAQSQNNPALESATTAFGNWLRGSSGNVPSPATVKAEIVRLAKQDPEAARNALRSILQRDADDAFRITKEGVAPADSGVGFVKRVGGTKAERDALIAAVEGVTGNATTATGFDKLLTILQRTGVTPGIGSPTATRTEAMREAGQGGLTNFALQGANLSRGSAVGWMQNLNERTLASKAWGDIADLLTQPDSVAKIRQLALMNPKSAKAEALAASILQGSQTVTGTAR
jgi:hypothetical protein